MARVNEFKSHKTRKTAETFSLADFLASKFLPNQSVEILKNPVNPVANRFLAFWFPNSFQAGWINEFESHKTRKTAETQFTLFRSGFLVSEFTQTPVNAARIA
jgi:hypothetical protein